MIVSLCCSMHVQWFICFRFRCSCMHHPQPRVRKILSAKGGHRSDVTPIARLAHSTAVTKTTRNGVIFKKYRFRFWQAPCEVSGIFDWCHCQAHTATLCQFVWHLKTAWYVLSVPGERIDQMTASPSLRLALELLTKPERTGTGPDQSLWVGLDFCFHLTSSLFSVSRGLLKEWPICATLLFHSGGLRWSHGWRVAHCSMTILLPIKSICFHQSEWLFVREVFWNKPF